MYSFILNFLKALSLYGLSVKLLHPKMIYYIEVCCISCIK